MTCESGAAGVWTALCGLALMIAMVVTIGYWLCVYHHEAAELRPYVAEPPSAAELILEDLMPVF
jgi:hypothetical protein